MRSCFAPHWRVGAKGSEGTMREGANEDHGGAGGVNPPAGSATTATIPPWTILAGLGSLSRQETCELLALFEDARLLNIALARARDLIGWQRDEDVDVVASNDFDQRVRERAAEFGVGWHQSTGVSPFATDEKEIHRPQSLVSLC